MRILLTGAAGFIGSHLAERLCAKGYEVVGFDNFDGFYARGIKENNLRNLRTKEGFSLVEGDLRYAGDLDRAFTAAGNIDQVIHLAALAGVRPSINQPERYVDVNIRGTAELLGRCRRRKINKVVMASSSSVYGATSAVPFSESDACGHPMSPYAATKRSCELLAFTEHHIHGTGITCLRFFTVYGPRQRPDLAIHKFTRAIATGKQIELYGDGSTSRDYTWIDDIIDGVVASVDQLARDTEGQYRVYNLGGKKTTTLRELVDLISKAVGREANIVWKPEQPGDMRHTCADLSVAEKQLGYRPSVQPTVGIPRFVHWWFSANEAELKHKGVKIQTLPYA